MYEIVKIFNYIVREQVFTNPFEYLIDNQLESLLLFSLFGSLVLYKISFAMCGIFYRRKSNKIIGSIGYMFFYYINIFVLTKLCQSLNNINIVISMYIVFVIILFIILYKMKNAIRQNIM